MLGGWMRQTSSTSLSAPLNLMLLIHVVIADGMKVYRIAIHEFKNDPVSETYGERPKIF